MTSICKENRIAQIYKTTLISHHVAGGVPMDTMKRTKVYSASDKYQAELMGKPAVSTFSESPYCKKDRNQNHKNQ